MHHKHGGDIYSYSQIRDFSANINERGMPDSVRRAAREAIDDSVHYPDPAYRSLRRALAEREGVTDRQIICGNGAAELMFALAAAVRPGSAFLAAPSFFEYEQALTAFGCRIEHYFLQEARGFGLEDAFLEAIPQETEMIILGNPNNPTGRLIEGDFLKKLFAVCRRRHIFLVLDESFFDFLTEEDRAGTLDGICEMDGMKNLFLLKSFTKMYGMPGLRFGYGLCSDEALLDKMRGLMQPWNVSVPAQKAAEAAASEGEFARATAARTAVHRAEMKKRMEEWGYRVYESGANFLLFRDPLEFSGCKAAGKEQRRPEDFSEEEKRQQPEWPATGKEQQRSENFAVSRTLQQERRSPGESLQQFCLRHGFLIRDCSNFPGLSRGYYRVCVRSHEENELLLSVLKKAAGR